MIKKLSILITEDDPKASELLGRMFANAGYKVTHANDGNEALEIIKEQDFSVLIMDMMLLEISGEETARTITKYIKNNMPIIAVTAKKMTPGQLVDLGISDYLQKPIDFTALTQAVQRVIATNISAHA